MPTPTCARCWRRSASSRSTTCSPTIPEEVRFGGPAGLPGRPPKPTCSRELAALAGAQPAGDRARHVPGRRHLRHLRAGRGRRRHEPLASSSPRTRRIRPSAARACCRPSSSTRRRSASSPGIDVSNASMYDGATALAEAVILARRPRTPRRQGRRLGRRAPRVPAGAGHRDRTGCGPAPLVVAGDGGGLTDLGGAARRRRRRRPPPSWSQQPNFFGGSRTWPPSAAIAHEAGALLVVVADPLSLGLLASPGEAGRRHRRRRGPVARQLQNFGGPGLGFIAARKELMRRMPGRLVGETVDVDGKRGFVLTLQTREQHIRREKATSNICSNHALNALAGARLPVVAGQGGPAGARPAAARARPPTCASACWRCPGVRPYTRGPGVPRVRRALPVAAGELVAALAERGYLAGLDLGRFRARASTTCCCSP